MVRSQITHPLRVANRHRQFDEPRLLRGLFDRADRPETARARGRPDLAMTISSPAAARSTSRESCVLAS